MWSLMGCFLKGEGERVPGLFSTKTKDFHLNILQIYFYHKDSPENAQLFARRGWKAAGLA